MAITATTKAKNFQVTCPYRFLDQGVIMLVDKVPHQSLYNLTFYCQLPGIRDILYQKMNLFNFIETSDFNLNENGLHYPGLNKQQLINCYSIAKTMLSA